MKRSRLSRFDACRDCLFWKIKQFVAKRQENYQRFMQQEIHNAN